MKVKELLNELYSSENYKKFNEENPQAFFCSAMFVLGETDKIDLNFFLPTKNKISSFSMPFISIINHAEEIKGQTEIKDLDFKIDIGNLKQEIEKKTDKKFPKIIAILQKGNWNVTCLNGLDMERLDINAYSGEFKQKGSGSIMDMVRFKKGNRKDSKN